MAQAGEDIEDFTLRGNGVGDAVGSEERKMESAGEFDGGLIAALFFDGEVALKFDVDVLVAEKFAELLEEFVGGGFSAGAESVSERAFVATGEAD